MVNSFPKTAHLNLSLDQFEKLYDETKQGVKAATDDDSDDEDSSDDGKFWMSWDDFLDEFESLTICHLDNDSEAEMRAKGTFRQGYALVSGTCARKKTKITIFTF